MIQRHCVDGIPVSGWPRRVGMAGLLVQHMRHEQGHVLPALALPRVDVADAAVGANRVI